MAEPLSKMVVTKTNIVGMKLKNTRTIKLENDETAPWGNRKERGARYFHSALHTRNGKNPL